MTRVVITGSGVMSALGNDLLTFEENVLSGFNGIQKITLCELENLRTKVAAEVKNYNPKDHFTTKKLRSIDRFSQFAILSARQAVQHSGLTFDESLSERTSVLFGTGVGGQETQDACFKRVYETKTRLPPLTVPKLIPSSCTSSVSIDLGITGPSMTLSSACSSSAHALIVGVMMLKSNQIDVAIVGGAEAPVNYGCCLAWTSLNALASETCRPFSKERDGTILGEGSATFVLETFEHAKNRNANILAEIIGVGMSSDAQHIVQPDAQGASSAMRHALLDAKINASDIQYINAHGTGTELNDITETQAIHTTFKSHAKKIAISSTKSMHGHALGATSLIEATACIAALKNQTIPPTTNYLGNDPKCDLNYVFNEPQKADLDIILSNSFSFGGLNASLIFKRI